MDAPTLATRETSGPAISLQRQGLTPLFESCGKKPWPTIPKGLDPDAVFEQLKANTTASLKAAER